MQFSISSAEFKLVCKLLNPKEFRKSSRPRFLKSHCFSSTLCQDRTHTEGHMHNIPKVYVITRSWVLIQPDDDIPFYLKLWSSYHHKERILWEQIRVQGEKPAIQLQSNSQFSKNSIKFCFLLLWFLSAKLDGSTFKGHMLYRWFRTKYMKWSRVKLLLQTLWIFLHRLYMLQATQEMQINH